MVMVRNILVALFAPTIGLGVVLAHDGDEKVGKHCSPSNACQRTVAQVADFDTPAVSFNILIGEGVWNVEGLVAQNNVHEEEEPNGYP